MTHDPLPILELSPVEFVTFVVMLSGRPSFWSIGPADKRQALESAARGWASAANTSAERMGHYGEPATVHEVAWGGKAGGA